MADAVIDGSMAAAACGEELLTLDAVAKDPVVRAQKYRPEKGWLRAALLEREDLWCWNHACGGLTVRTLISGQAPFISGQPCPKSWAALPKVWAASHPCLNNWAALSEILGSPCPKFGQRLPEVWAALSGFLGSPAQEPGQGCPDSEGQLPR